MAMARHDGLGVQTTRTSSSGKKNVEGGSGGKPYRQQVDILLGASSGWKGSGLETKCPTVVERELPGGRRRGA